MSLDDSRKLVHIKVQDGSLVERATTDPLLEVVP
jgi:hypothetical protein